VESSAEQPEWKITERSVTVAQSRANTWLRFANRALDRTRAAGGVFGALPTEAWSCVLALNHVRTCAVLAVTTATVPAAREAAVTALARFDSAVPRLKDARDFLEREDAYVLGTGNLQQPNVGRTKRTIDQAAAEEWAYVPDFINGDRERPVVKVGSQITIDLSDACAEAAALGNALYAAAYLQGVQPSGLKNTSAS
jgi:hypothetical protein